MTDACAIEKLCASFANAQASQCRIPSRGTTTLPERTDLRWHDGSCPRFERERQCRACHSGRDADRHWAVFSSTGIREFDRVHEYSTLCPVSKRAAASDKDSPFLHLVKVM
jgi:hypothetical protein